jgi:hypothetical protein
MKKMRVTLLVLVLTMAMIIPAGVATADSTFEVSGNYAITVTGVHCLKSEGSQQVISVCVSHISTYDGDMVGTAQESLYYGFDTNSKAVNSVGTKTFTGKVLGKQGTFTAQVRHQSLGNGGYRVEQTIISGTGELTKLQGKLVFMVTQTDPGVWKGTYSGSVTFTP